MSKRFIITQIAEDGAETVLAHDAIAEDVLPVIVADAMASDILPDHERETREAAIEMVGRMQGFEMPRESREAEIYRRTYRIEELPDDPVALDEFYNARFLRPKFIKLLCRFPGSKLRFTIYANESQHRGRPHCTASRSEKSANFEIPSGKKLIGDINPDEREATQTIRKHGEELLSLWHRMRPDDQKL